jgi:hypothetical protein
MKRKPIILCAGLLFTAACLTTATPGSDAVNTEVARQLTSMAALTQSGGQPGATPQVTDSAPGELPTVTPTGTLPPSPTPTDTATVTPTQSFTPPADDPRPSLGSPSYLTTFPDSTNWYLYEDENVKFSVFDNEFIMTAKQANQYDSWTLTSWKLTNYYMELKAVPDVCSGRDRYGLVVGVPFPANNPSYLLRFSCDGYYSFGYFDSTIDYKFKYLKEWTKSDYILAGSGQINRMGFKAEGSHLSLFANGHFLTDLTEPSFGEGRTGMFVGSVNTVNFTVRVKEFAYWVLP